MAEMMPFLFGGNTNMSIEELRRRQAAAAAVASQKRKFPTTFGEGMTYLGEAVGDRMENDRLREAEARIGAQRMPAVPADTAAPAARPAVLPGRRVPTERVAPAARPAVLPGRRVPTERVAPDAVPSEALPGAAPVGPATGSFSEASPESLDRITSALMTSPQEVAQMDPTLGASQGAPGFQSDDVEGWKRSIGGIESSNDYGAVGVMTKHGQALGRYGVMEVNVPKWTQEALGQPLTRKQFLADSDAQDAVFLHKFGQYVAKYGPEKAARAWYGGEGNINNLNATDAHEKLSVYDYGRDFISRLRGRRSDAEGDTSTAPVQLAALGGPSGTMTDAPPIGMGGGQMMLPAGGASDTPAGFGTPAPLGGGSAPNYVPSPRPPPPSIRPSVEPEPDPTVTGDIKPMSVAPNQFAQVGPEMFSPRPMMSDASAALPAARPSVAAPGAAARPPGATAAGVEIGPAPAPMPFPSPGPEPRREGPSKAMLHYQDIAADPRWREDIRADAANRFKVLQAQQESDYVRKWTDWRTDADKEREYNLGDPQRRQTLTQGHLANIKLRQDLEGEGFKELTPEAAARLYPGSTPPEGQAIWLNRKGEPKFGPAAPKTTVNIDQKAEGKGLEELQKKMADHMVEQFTAGSTAADDLTTLTQMRALTARVNTGPVAVAKQIAGKWGIKTEGISDIEALNAMISRVIPQQRVPGTGASSDLDVNMFKAAVPDLMKTREGNMLIMDTMEQAAANKMARAEVAGKVISGQLTIAQGTQELLKLQAEAKGMSDRVRQHLEVTGVKLPEAIVPSPAATDAAAREWLKNNPDHPKADAVRRSLGAP